jgi:hypothetical protein
MQLRRVALAAFSSLIALTVTTPSRSDVVDFDARTTVYREGAPYGSMSIITPSASIAATPAESFRLNAGWNADIVSGASVKTRQYTKSTDSPDLVSAASVHDFRQVANGGFGFTHKATTFDVGYSYSWENDYRSNSFDATAKTELFQRSMELSIAYAHNWDSVCDRVQVSPEATERLSLAASNGCFTNDPTKTTHDISVDSIQGGWLQAWTPTFVTQVTGSFQLLDGFLSNPYREVLIGTNIVRQEYVPDVRVRYAAGLKANWWLRPIATALRLSVRGYRDSWNVQSVTSELEIERYLLPGLRLRARGRYYQQTHAAFYADDYTTEHPGQYYTGDRDLSQMRSWLAGLRLLYGSHAKGKRWLGLLEAVEASIGGDVIAFKYLDFTVLGEPLAKTAFVGTVGVTLTF